MCHLESSPGSPQPASSATQPVELQLVSSVTYPTEPAEVVQALSNMEGKAADVIPSQEDCTLHQVSIQEDQYFPTTQEVPRKKVQNGAPEDHCAASVLEGEGTKARLDSLQPWPTPTDMECQGSSCRHPIP